MSEISVVAKEISKNKNLEMNLPKYGNLMMSLYNRLSYIKLSMNYYTYYDMIADNKGENISSMEKLLDELNDIISSHIAGSANADTGMGAVGRLDSIRNEIISTMEVVTSYVDKFRIYEYVLNRIEFKFDETVFDDTYYNNGFTNDIMHYILSDSDNVVVNNKICEVVGQLPMRLTKNKFFELLKNAFSLYNGSDVKSLNDFIYMIRTSAGIDKPEGFETAFPDLYEIYNELGAVDYNALTKDEFDEVNRKLLYAVDAISHISDLYMMFTELVNDAYTILLSNPYAFVDAKESENCKAIIQSVLNSFNKKDYDAPDDDINDRFIAFEGIQERIGASINENEYALDIAVKEHSDILQSIMQDKIYNSLKVISKLQSGSLFVALEDKETDVVCDEIIIDREFEQLVAEFMKLFEGCSSNIRRAVMATVLSSLPVFFNNVDEIQSYINVSLSQCSDVAEKKACVNLIQMLMEE